MAKKTPKAICAIINGTCPQNGPVVAGSVQPPGRYCPHWRLLAVTDKNGEAATVAECSIPVMFEYAASVHKAGWITGRFLTEANHTEHHIEQETQKRIEAKLDALLRIPDEKLIPALKHMNGEDDDQLCLSNG